MLKSGLTAPAYEKAFIRDALTSSGIRLDGRGPFDIRPVDIQLKRNETSVTSEVRIGSTVVVTEVVSKIIDPYPDRPDEGFLHFNTNVVGLTESAGNISFVEISRALERIIRDSKSIDTESLCIVSGEKVWEVRCDVRVVDGSGGNVLDASILSAMSALKAFRKPEISVLQTEIVDGAKTQSTIQIHHSDDREPMPLSLFHTPLSLTIGVFKKAGTAASTSSSSTGVQTTEIENANDRYVFILDPSLEEERAMDGKITYSLNNHKDLCAVNKPGGVPLSVETMMFTARLVHKHISSYHTSLNEALNALEGQVLLEREQRREILRLFQEAQRQQQDVDRDNEMEIIDSNVEQAGGVDAGIDRDDPILDWANLHQPVFLREVK